MNNRTNPLNNEQLHGTPEFILEVSSTSNSLMEKRDKMAMWINNDVEVFLILNLKIKFELKITY